MNIWMVIGLLVISNFTAWQTGMVVTSLFHRKFRICEMKLISELYLRIWVEMIVGCTMCGYVYMVYFAKQPNWFGIAWGVTFYALIMVVTDIKNYNRLTKAMKTLNIDTDEKLEQFINENT